MFKKINIALLIFSILVLGFVFITSVKPLITNATSWELQSQYYLQVPIGTLDTVDDFTRYIPEVYKFAIAFLIVLSIIMTMIGGFIWLSAAGKASAISTGQEYIKNALIGLAIGLFSYTILYQVNPELVKIQLPYLETQNLEGITIGPCDEDYDSNKCNQLTYCIYYNDACRSLASLDCMTLDESGCNIYKEECAWLDLTGTDNYFCRPRADGISGVKNAVLNKTLDDAALQERTQFLLQCAEYKTNNAACATGCGEGTERIPTQYACISRTNNSFYTPDTLEQLYPSFNQQTCENFGDIGANYILTWINNQCIKLGKEGAICGGRQGCVQGLECDWLNKCSKP